MNQDRQRVKNQRFATLYGRTADETRALIEARINTGDPRCLTCGTVATVMHTLRVGDRETVTYCDACIPDHLRPPLDHEAVRILTE